MGALEGGWVVPQEYPPQKNELPSKNKWRLLTTGLKKTHWLSNLVFMLNTTLFLQVLIYLVSQSLLQQTSAAQPCKVYFHPCYHMGMHAFGHTQFLCTTGPSDEVNEDAGGSPPGSSAAAPVLLWRLLLGMDAAPAQKADKSRGQRPCTATPPSGPHALLLESMAAALGCGSCDQDSVSKSESSHEQGGYHGGHVQCESGSGCWQPNAAHASAAQLLYMACCLAPHTPALLAAASLPAGSAASPASDGAGAASTSIHDSSAAGILFGHAAVLGQCVQVAVALLGLAGAVQGICVMCGGEPGGVVAGQWPGWQQQRSSASSAQDTNHGSVPGAEDHGNVTSPFWPLLGNAVSRAARLACASHLAAEAAFAPGTDAAAAGGSGSAHPSASHPQGKFGLLGSVVVYADGSKRLR